MKCGNREMIILSVYTSFAVEIGHPAPPPPPPSLIAGCSTAGKGSAVLRLIVTTSSPSSSPQDALHPILYTSYIKLKEHKILHVIIVLVYGIMQSLLYILLISIIIVISNFKIIFFKLLIIIITFITPKFKLLPLPLK